MIKSTPIRRDWREARAKCDHEQVCRVCRRVPSGALGDRLEAAHVIPRKRNEIEVEAVDVVPLCTSDHLAYDARRLDLLPFLTPDEQSAATLRAGGITGALKRICGRQRSWEGWG